MDLSQVSASSTCVPSRTDDTTNTAAVSTNVCWAFKPPFHSSPPNDAVGRPQTSITLIGKAQVPRGFMRSSACPYIFQIPLALQQTAEPAVSGRSVLGPPGASHLFESRTNIWCLQGCQSHTPEGSSATTQLLMLLGLEYKSLPQPWLGEVGATTFAGLDGVCVAMHCLAGEQHVAPSTKTMTIHSQIGASHLECVHHQSQIKSG